MVADLERMVEADVETWRTTLQPPREFGDGHGNVLDYVPAPDLAARAAHLIETRPHLEHLAPLRIGYVWKRKGGSAKGKPKLGQCQRASGLLAHYSELDFVVWLAADWAVELGLTDKQLEAALYHELLHIGCDPESGEAVLVGHDVEMFRAEVEHYGLWRPAIRDVAETFQQLTLPGDDR